MKLLVLDVEGTLFDKGFVAPGTSITSTVWQGLAQSLGSDAVAAEVATHDRWARGDYRTYVDWMKDTIEIHQAHGLTESLFRSVIHSATYNAGVSEFFANLNRAAWEPVLVSGGFAELARRAQVDFSIHHAFAACEYFFDSRGSLASYNLLPCDFEGKIDFIRLMLAEYGLAERDWVFVGDGANDVPVAVVAPFSVAYCPHPELARVATTTVESFSVLTDVVSRLEERA